MAGDVRIDLVPPDGCVATSLIDRYLREVDDRLPEGFDPDQSVTAPADELAPPHGAFLVAFLDAEPVGCGGVRRLNGQIGEIKRMYVDPTARGLGVGRRLLSALEQAAVELGCAAVRLDTHANLTEAIALYRKAGYVEIPPYNDNRYAANWFEKRLSSFRSRSAERGGR